MCIEGAGGAATTACFDCVPGYWLSFTSATTGTCTRCAAGKGIAGGKQDGTQAATTNAAAQRLSATQTADSCTACHATCAECTAPTVATACTKCAAGAWAAAYAAGTAPALSTGTCSGTCTTAGKTRDVSATALTAVETEAGVCTANCNAACAECKGTAATGCTKCAAGHYATAFTTPLATCTACASGKGRAAPAAAPTAIEAATVCDVTCAAGIANCKGATATDALWCLADYWYASNACTKCDSGKTKAAGTAMPTAAETAASCTGSGAAAGSSATLIQALCGASVAAYALF